MSEAKVDVNAEEFGKVLKRYKKTQEVYEI